MIIVGEGTSGTLSRTPYSTATREGPTLHKMATFTIIAISGGSHDLQPGPTPAESRTHYGASYPHFTHATRRRR